MPHQKDVRDLPKIFYTVVKKAEFYDQNQELRSSFPQKDFSYFECLKKIPQLQDDEIILEVPLNAFGKDRAEIKLKLVDSGEWRSPNCILKMYVASIPEQKK